MINILFLSLSVNRPKRIILIYGYLTYNYVKTEIIYKNRCIVRQNMTLKLITIKFMVFYAKLILHDIEYIDFNYFVVYFNLSIKTLPYMV